MTYNGALVTWAIHRKGTLGSWIRDEVGLLLAPYRLQAPTGEAGMTTDGTAST